MRKDTTERCCGLLLCRSPTVPLTSIKHAPVIPITFAYLTPPKPVPSAKGVFLNKLIKKYWKKGAPKYLRMEPCGSELVVWPVLPKVVFWKYPYNIPPHNSLGQYQCPCTRMAPSLHYYQFWAASTTCIPSCHAMLFRVWFVPAAWKLHFFRMLNSQSCQPLPVMQPGPRHVSFAQISSVLAQKNYPMRHIWRRYFQFVAMWTAVCARVNVSRSHNYRSCP